MILRRDRVAKGVDGVWHNVAEVNAATQRILVSGDSAARSAALAEAAARKAVLDSVARANAGAAGATDSTNAVTPRPTPVRRPTPADTGARRDSTRPADTIPLRPGVTR